MGPAEAEARLGLRGRAVRHRENWALILDVFDYLADLGLGELPESLRVSRGAASNSPSGRNPPHVVRRWIWCAGPMELARRLAALGVSHILINLPEIRQMSWIPGEYVDWAGAEEERVFFEFLRERCRPVFDRSGVVVYKVEPVQ